MCSTEQAKTYDHFLKGFAFECKFPGKEDAAYGLLKVLSQHFFSLDQVSVLIVIHLFKLKNCEVKK
jgi:hypothetical protein